jgi:hypothetical protein
MDYKLLEINTLGIYTEESSFCHSEGISACFLSFRWIEIPSEWQKTALY